MFKEFFWEHYVKIETGKCLQLAMSFWVHKSYLLCTSSLGKVRHLLYIFKFMVEVERRHEADSGKLKDRRRFVFSTEL